MTEIEELKRDLRDLQDHLHVGDVAIGQISAKLSLLAKEPKSADPIGDYFAGGSLPDMSKEPKLVVSEDEDTADIPRKETEHLQMQIILLSDRLTALEKKTSHEDKAHFKQLNERVETLGTQLVQSITNSVHGLSKLRDDFDKVVGVLNAQVNAHTKLDTAYRELTKRLQKCEDESSGAALKLIEFNQSVNLGFGDFGKKLSDLEAQLVVLTERSERFV